RDALAVAQTQHVQAETRWEGARQNLEEQRRLLDEAQARLGETFKALSVDALRESNTAFLQLAQRTLAAELEPRQQAMDGIVRLPNGREVIVDSKVPLIAYLDALSASTEEERQAALARHGQQVRHHMNALSVKAYWEEFAKAPAFVVMFIPGESFVAAAAHAD